MSRNSQKSLGSTLVLILFGIIALFGGVKWLVLLIPAAILVCYSAAPLLRSGRN
jgi:hypothetical protein